MKKLVWRLGKLPTPQEVSDLLKEEIITQDEAREILFNTETDEERDSNSLKDEIKFLREVIKNLSENSSKTVEIIQKVEPRYFQYGWYQPYYTWCTAGISTNLIGTGTTTIGGYALNDGSTPNITNVTTAYYTGGSGSGIAELSTKPVSKSFTDISTF